jgi:hypothetical protein
VLGKKSRLAAGVAAAGACVLLAACSPVKMGAAAIVGNQRITSSSLDSQVSNLQQSVTQYGSATPVPTADMPKAVLGWLISFAVRDRTAQDLGVTVGPTDANTAIAFLYQGTTANGQSFSSPQEMATADGVPPDLLTEFGQWFAVELAYLKDHNGGKIPTDQATATKLLAQLSTADCQAAKALGVQVNPQYGQLSYNSSNGLYGVVAGPDTLSAAGGPASPAASPYAPAC